MGQLIGNQLKHYSKRKKLNRLKNNNKSLIVGNKNKKSTKKIYIFT